MGRPVVFFDIGCRDKDATAAFYTQLFDWRTEDVNPFSCHLKTDADQGISGAVTALGHEPHHYVMVYVEVEDLAATIERVQELGGETTGIGPLPTPDGRMFAWLKDPEGTLFGVFTPRGTANT